MNMAAQRQSLATTAAAPLTAITAPGASLAARMLANPAAALSAVFILALALGQVLPSRSAQIAVLTLAAAAASLWVLGANVHAQSASAEGQMRTLEEAIAAMDASGYTKNNEDIQLRDRRRFRYVFLDARMVRLLNRLLNGFAPHYADAAYSTLFYCEAFMRQYYRVLDGRVRDPLTAREYMNAVFNHIATLNYNSSVFERREIQQLRSGFQQLLGAIYDDMLVRLGRHSEVGAPAAHDPGLGDATTFGLYA